MLVRIGIAAQVKGVSPSTLRRWKKEERLQPAGRTRGGHRRYKLTQLLGKEEKGSKQSEKIVLGYARVSATKQKREMERQQEQVRSFAHQQG